MRRFVFRFVLGAFVLLVFYEVVQLGVHLEEEPEQENEETLLFAAQTLAHLARAVRSSPAPDDAAAVQKALGVTVTPLSESDWVLARAQASLSLQQGGVHLVVQEPGWEEQGVMVAMLPLGPVRIDAWSLSTEADDAIHASHWLSLLVLVAGMVLLGRGLAAAPVRHLRRLAQTARALESGDLSARAEVPEGGLVAPVALAMNDMSARIQGVVEWQELMLQTVAHELRTPLARIRFVTSRVADETDEAERAEARADLDDDLTELDDVVSSVLSLVRADHGMALQQEPVELDSLLRDTLARFRSPPRDTGHPVELDFECPLEAPVLALLDRPAASRVFDNLLRNATAHAHTRVRVVVERDPETIVVAVEDDGPGVPEAHRSRIFEPFVRVDDERAQTGTGLGLAIVERLVEAHGQAVTVVESELGGLRVETRWSAASRGVSRTAEGGEQARDSNSEKSGE